MKNEPENRLDPSDLKQSWKELESKSEDRFWNALRLPVGGDRNALLVLDTRGIRHFLVPAKRRRYQTHTNSVLSLDVGEHSFTFIDGTTEAGRYLDISCLVPQLNDQFDTVIQSICRSFDGIADLAEAAAREVGRWRELFSYLSSARMLTTQEKMGAFAELLVLEKLTRYPEIFSIDSWTGPSGEPHDFELPAVSLEVKGVGIETRSISIHGLTQLEPAESKQLRIIVISLAIDSKGLSVGELLDRIATGSPYEHEIRRRAASAGIFRSNGDDDRFIVKNVAFSDVDEQFPRLKAAGQTVETGGTVFTNVRYEIALSALHGRFLYQDELDLREITDVQG